MRIQQQSRQFEISFVSFTFSLIILLSCSQMFVAQQKDDEGTKVSSTESNNAPTRPTVNFNIITLMNGEYLEMFGANSSRGILRGHPTLPGAELGTTTADPLIFSTNGLERMRIWPDGSIGIGTNIAPAASAFDFATNSAMTYAPAATAP